MADRQLVCLSLIHPPQVQLFSQIHEILWRVFLPQMQLLGSSVDDPQINYPSSEPKQIVRQIRQVAGDGMIKMFNFMIESQNVATEYLKLLRTLPDVKGSSEWVQDVHTSTFGGTRRAEEMQQHFVRIREELDSGLRRITIVFADGNQDTLAGITESVTKLFSAIDELNELFQECLDYFEEIEKQTSDPTIIESNPPSLEETHMMREKWGMLGERLEELANGWNKFANLVNGRQIIQDGDIQYNPEAMEEATNDSPPPIIAMEGSTLSYILNATRRMDHSEISANGARPTTIPPDSSSTQAKTPFWRKLFRCGKRVNKKSVDEPTDRDGAAPAPPGPSHKSKISFWRRLIRPLRKNNSAHPTNE